MPKQPAFPGLRHAMKKKQTRREKFLAEMEAVVPWTRLLALIEPHYPEGRAEGRAPADAAGDDAAGLLPAATGMR
jgi:IS5 family transposase